MYWNKSRASLLVLFAFVASYLVGYEERSWNAGLWTLFIGLICVLLVFYITLPSWRWKRFETSCMNMMQQNGDRSQ